MRVEIRPGLEAYRFASEPDGDRPQRFIQHTDGVSIHDAASWEEIDELYESMEDEIMRFAGVLERNSAVLIRTGIAQRLVSYTSRLYGRESDESIGTAARFHVRTGEVTPEGRPLARVADPEVIALSYRNPQHGGDPCAIGRRALLGAQDVEYTPLEPEFDEKDVQISAELLNDLLDGSFPHIAPGNLTLLIVHGSLDTKMEAYTTKERQEMLASASVF